MQQIELLAPAGNIEALEAAVQNGADAIYLGGAEFGARAYASNFDRSAMKEAVDYCHIRGVKVYVTVNILVKDNEIKDLMDYIKFLYEIDIDAVIVQDIGVFNLIKNMFPDFEIHASTQMTLHNKRGVELLKNMGVHRAVLARELTVDEIRNIYNETGVELEIFIHGALCVSYSGQCLMSSFIGGRSGNRGRCAQPCRREYDLLSLNTGKSLENNRAFHLSMRDLNTVEDIGKLIDAGVTSFKIEGRMKKPQYVASIVRGYRRAIDTYLSSKKSLKDKTIQEEMEQMFNRKFTKGYLFNTSKSEVINIEKPNNRGLYLGKVDEFNKRENRLRIKLEVDIAQGDGIEIWNRASDDMGGTVRNIYINNKLVKDAKKGQTVEIEMKGNIQKGDEVYKTLNISLMNELERTYIHHKENRKTSIFGEVEVKVNQTVKLSMWDMEGHTAYVESDTTAEKAIKVALTEQKLLDQLSKLGNTPFILENLDIRLGKNCSIPVSILNNLRRDAIDKLIQQRKARYNRYKLDDKSFKSKLEDLRLKYGEQKEKEKGKLKAVVKVDTLTQLKAVLNYSVSRIYYSDISTLKEAIDLCSKKNIDLYLKTPAILRDEEYDRLIDSLKGIELKGILAGDLGVVKLNKEYYKLPIIGDSSLNVMNSYTINSLKNIGLNGVTLSPELDFKSINKLSLSNEIEIEAVIYGKLAVMTTEYCPLVQESQCDHKCEECRYPKYRYNFGLNDAKNITFPFGKDFWGRSIILNSKPLFMIDKISDFKKLNINYLRLEFTDETTETIEELMTIFAKNILSNKGESESKEYINKLEDGFTRGHYYRGVE